MSISTGPVIPLSCTISIDSYSRYWSFICIISLMIHIRVQYLTDHIIKLNTVEMRSLRLRTKVDSKLSGIHFAEHPSKSRAHRMCSEQLFDAGKRLLPEFSWYKFCGQFQPTNAVARRSFRAISGNRANGVVKAWLLRVWPLRLCR